MSKIDYDVLIGDCLETMKQIEPEKIDCVVTSPPYWGLRDYGTASWEGGDEDCDHSISVPTRWNDPKKGTKVLRPEVGHRGGTSDKCHKCGAARIDNQIGLENTPEEYVENMVKVFREVKRILKPCGTVWLNRGDSYWGGKGQSGMKGAEYQEARTDTLNKGYHNATGGSKKTRPSDQKHSIIKPKDLVGIPWRVAFALQADGWWLRQDLIWHKPNPMPESVTDRCTKNHEYIFLLTKSKSYFYDHVAIKEGSIHAGKIVQQGTDGKYAKDGKPTKGFETHVVGTRLVASGRNKRSVWTVTTRSFTGAHFAIFPPDLIEPCILAGTSAHGCCGDCGAPWKRVITKERDNVHWKEGREVSEAHRSDDFTKQGKRVPRNARMDKVTTNLTGGWQPTCECHGKLVKRDVVIPATLTREEVTKVGWGASLDGSYHGKAQKEYEGTGAENASEVKKRIIENATKDRIRKGVVYESDLALDKHPVVPSVVFDPFGGSGTTAGVAIKNGRRAILCELNEDYIEMMEDRIAGIANGWRKGQMTLGDFN